MALFSATALLSNAEMMLIWYEVQSGKFRLEIYYKVENANFSLAKHVNGMKLNW
jgi:hypothetical protein